MLGRLTHARPEVAEYPFTTRQALPGMMPYEDIAFQLVDLPPLSHEYVEHWVFDLIRAADLVWIVVDGADSIDGQQLVQGMLRDKHIAVVPADAGPPEQTEPGWACKPALVVVTGRDRPGSADNLQILRELLEVPWPVASVSTVDGAGLDELARLTFEALRVIRVYTKQPGKPADREQPFTLPIGATVGDLAVTIHKDILENLKFARVWGESAFDGQSVQRDHVLADGDIVEIHA